MYVQRGIFDGSWLIKAGSRRLLTYQRLNDRSVDADALTLYRLQRLELQGVNGDGSADELNAFRRKVFSHAGKHLSCANKHTVFPRLQRLGMVTAQRVGQNIIRQSNVVTSGTICHGATNEQLVFKDP